MSEHIPVLGSQFYSKLEGDPLVGVTLEMEPWSQPTRLVQLTRPVMMLVLRRTSPVHLSRTKWPRLVKRIWEPSLPVPVPVQVEGCGRVRDVFVVDDQEAAGGVLAVGGASWRSRQGVVDPWMEPSPADPLPPDEHHHLQPAGRHG